MGIVQHREWSVDYLQLRAHARRNGDGHRHGDVRTRAAGGHPERRRRNDTVVADVGETLDSTGRHDASLLLQLQLRDGGAVDLVGAVGQAQGAGARPEVGEREVVGDPGAAVGLYRTVEDAQRYVGGDDLYLGYFRAGFFIAFPVHHVGRFQRQEPCLLYLDPRVGDPLHDHTLLGERLAERLATLDPLAHQLYSPLGYPDETHAVVDAPRPEAALRDGKALALVPDHVRSRDARAFDGDLRVAVRGVVVAED